MAEAEHFSNPETGLDDEPSRELARKGIAWTAAWQRRQGQAPPLLYHYTDAAGFQGIVQSRELWASNAAFLNDSSELVYIREVLGVVTNDLMARYEHRRVRQLLTLVERHSPTSSSRASTSSWRASAWNLIS